MNICVAALCVGLLALSSLSAAVYSKDEGLTKKEKLDKNTLIVLESINPSVTKSTTAISNEDPKQKDISSSIESNFHKHNENDSSESDENSSSEENKRGRTIQKRSLDSKQDSINTIGGGVNQTFSKSNSDLEKDISSPLKTINSNTSSSESVSYTNEGNPMTVPPSGTAVITDELPLETTTIENDLTYETVTETTTDRSDSTTEKESTATESGTTSETESEETETESETTPEIQSETTSLTESEPISSSTTETSEYSNSSTEENEDETSPSINSTPSTEIESPTSEEKQEETLMEVAIGRVNKLSDQIRLVLGRYRKEGVVVLPGQNFFPDPMQMQDFKQSFSVGNMDFKNMRVYGLSNFTVEHINTDVDRMQVYVLLKMKRLVILGNYTLRTFFSRAAGPFNVTLLDVDSEGVAEIETNSEGHLEATDSAMDMFTQDMRIDFKNLGFYGSMFQGVVSSVGDALFNSIKPQILERVNLVIRTDVNKKLKELSTKFINKVNPVDLAFSEGRRYVRTQGYDPYHMKDHTFVLGGLVYVNITQFWVEGLSRFYRVGNLSLSMDAGVIEIGVHVITEKLTGQCTWSGQTFGIVKSGKTNFTVDHLQVRALVNQSLDVRHKPQLEDLDLELGWVRVTMDSPMTLSLMIEGIINAFPRLIRHIIVDTLEQPLKEKIQDILDKINVEEIVASNLPRLDNYGL